MEVALTRRVRDVSSDFPCGILCEMPGPDVRAFLHPFSPSVTWNFAFLFNGTRVYLCVFTLALQRNFKIAKKKSESNNSARRNRTARMAGSSIFMTSNVVNNARRTPPLFPAVRVANSAQLTVSHNVRELWYLLRTSERFSPDIYRVRNTWYSPSLSRPRYINTRYSPSQERRNFVVCLKNIPRDIRYTYFLHLLACWKSFGKITASCAETLEIFHRLWPRAAASPALNAA